MPKTCFKGYVVVRSLMKTFVFAKMVEFCDVKQNDSILVIGCLTGYSVAILSKLAGYVFGLDDNKDFTKHLIYVVFRYT